MGEIERLKPALVESDECSAIHSQPTAFSQTPADLLGMLTNIKAGMIIIMIVVIMRTCLCFVRVKARVATQHFVTKIFVLSQYNLIDGYGFKSTPLRTRIVTVDDSN